LMLAVPTVLSPRSSRVRLIPLSQEPALHIWMPEAMRLALGDGGYELLTSARVYECPALVLLSVALSPRALPSSTHATLTCLAGFCDSPGAIAGEARLTLSHKAGGACPPLAALHTSLAVPSSLATFPVPSPFLFYFLLITCPPLCPSRPSVASFAACFAPAHLSTHPVRLSTCPAGLVMAALPLVAFPLLSCLGNAA
jgi:hypothetical protein